MPQGIPRRTKLSSPFVLQRITGAGLDEAGVILRFASLFNGARAGSAAD
jgi:hypothetical protein